MRSRYANKNLQASKKYKPYNFWHCQISGSNGGEYEA
jgi:hypothetical protein